MDPITIAALVGGGTALAGGIMNSGAHREAVHIQGENARRDMANNEKLQREFAQNGVRWKAADAEAAGIHPLAALGASTHSFSPMSVGGSLGPDTSMGDAVAAMGQNVSRAISATSTREERAFNTQMQIETLKNAKLKNDLLAQQLTFNHVANNPPIPGPTDAQMIPGQGNAFTVKKAEAFASRPGVPAQEAGAINSYGYMRTPEGGYAVVPSTDAKQRTEDDLVQQTMWAIRNQLMPSISGVTPPDPKNYPLPKGKKEWKWDAWRQEFRPSSGRGRYFSPSTGYGWD